jgi:hypothetical protein
MERGRYLIAMMVAALLILPLSAAAHTESAFAKNEKRPPAPSAEGRVPRDFLIEIP